MCLAHKLNPCTLENLLPQASTWNLQVHDRYSADVDYRLSPGVYPIDNKCGLHFSATIMAIVCCMNAVKCLGILYTLLLFWHQGFSLVTLGDAIASFLAVKDKYTEGICLVPQSDFQVKGWPKRPLRWHGPQTIRMFSVTRWAKWITIGS